MSAIEKISKIITDVKKFIDFDKDKRIFYNNLYLDEFKIVIKIPPIHNINF